MTIPDLQERGKAYIGRIPAGVLIVLVLVLSATAAFGLGILAGRDMERQGGADKGLWIEDRVEQGGGPAAVVSSLKTLPQKDGTLSKASAATSGTYMASKNGTKYYLPTCSGASRIKETNRVWFTTKEEAINAGYQPAANCPGL